MNKIPLRFNQPEDTSAHREARDAREQTPMTGMLAVGFGVLGIFGPGIIFTPLGFLFSIIALLKGQGLWALAGILLAVGGFITSPLLMGVVGMGAVLVLFDWNELLKPIYDMIGGGLDV